MRDLSLIFIPLFPLVGFLINGSFALLKSVGKAKPQKGFISFLACLMPFLSFVLSLYVFFRLLDAPYEALTAHHLFDWMVLEHFQLDFGLIVDHLSAVMILIVTGVGFFIHLYSVGYMGEDENYGRYMSYINLFLFFMLTLVMADSLVLLFVGWEGVGLCSYLLIGFWFTDSEKAQAGKKAFVVNRIGDFAFLVGMFAIVALFTSSLGDSVAEKNYLSFAFIQEHARVLAPMAFFICLSLFIGATGKSAQIPLYVWLPDAMAGPTPVSALIHAATMVTAGIYLIARLSFLYLLSPLAMQVVATIGLATALLAALIAITQYDIKKVLAYSTVSQLGYMVLALGVGGFSAAIFHVMTHAFFKACLFLGAGSVIHSLHHEQDIRHMGGLMKRMPVTAWTFLLSTLAIAGTPPLSGFFSKDEILYLTYNNAPHPAFYWIALFTAGLTAFYMTRLFVYTFLGKTRYHHPEKIHESPWVMTLPLVVLAVLAVVAGFIGLPHVIGHNHLAEWMAFLGQKEPANGSAELEWFLMGLSVAWGVFCILLAYVIFRYKHHITTTLKSNFNAVYKFMSNKFKVDELYNALIVKPIKWTSDKFLFKIFDVRIIDGLMVHGFVNLSRFFMKSFSAIHTGFISYYLVYFILGLFFVLAFVVLG